MKQTALQQLIAWGDERMKTEPMKTLSFAEVIDKAEELLEIEKEQMIEFADNVVFERLNESIYAPFNVEQYYNETYNK